MSTWCYNESNQEIILSKKHKRRLQQLCGFQHLDREERLARANEILNSAELKQEICLQILGTTFKDVERAMKDLINERQVTPRQEEELEDRANNPEKYEEDEFDTELEFKLNKSSADKVKVTSYRSYTMDEVNDLITASEQPLVRPFKVQTNTNYPTYSHKDVAIFMEEHYAYEARVKASKEGKE